MKLADPICKRKRYIKKCLEKNVYDQLVGIIIEYDYDFSGNLYKIIDTNDTIHSIQALSDYKIVICSTGDTLKILDINSDEYEYTTITHENGGVYRAVISPNGYIITIPFNVGTIDVRDKKNKCIMQIMENYLLFCIICLSDGRIVTGTGTKKLDHLCNKAYINIWNPNNGKPEIVIENNSTVLSIAALTDQLLVSGDNEGNVKIWNSITGELKRTLIGHTREVSCIAVLPGGLIVSGSWDNTLKIWNQDGHCINTLVHNENVHSVSILPDGMLLSQSHTLLKMWNPLNGECVLSLKNNMYGCTVLKNGLVCVFDSEIKKIYIYY